MMDIGIFLPIAKGEFIISPNVPQTWPTWELNRDVTLKCGSLGFEFAFPDFDNDIDTFGEHILPKLESRKG